jgi:putative membrane protein
MRATLIAAGLAVAGLWAVGNLSAQDKRAGNSPDSKFVMTAAQGGLLEVRLGELASDNAASPDVKAFGKRMVEDHSKANQDLMKIAEKKAIPVRQELNRKHQALFDQLKELKGAEFDRSYMRHMVKDHEEDAKEFDQEARGGQDPDVKAFAARTLPTIKEHLEMARKISGKLSGGR